MNLQFGLGGAVPDTVTSAWGARWIYPDDMLWDRQSYSGSGTEFDALKKWLDAGAIARAKAKAASADRVGWISSSSHDTVILFKDSYGVIVGSPNASYGYLYVAAWIHHNDPTKQKYDGMIDLTLRSPAKGKKRSL